MPKKQKVYSGNGVYYDLKNTLEKDSPKKIFLVTGNKSYKKSGAELFFSNIFKLHSLVHFCNFTENPKIEDVCQGIKLFKENNCDYIIAIGGGSVIDMAKLINIGQGNSAIFYDIILGSKKIEQFGKKLIAIPTTSGAGSEATHFAVIYVDSKKYSIAHKEYILPDCVILIPELTYSLGKYQTAVSGIDAFAQAIESYWSINSNRESKIFSEKAISLIIKNLPLVINNNDLDARSKMLFASYLAGQAINITKTTGAHAMAYIFTTKYDLPHGHAVALTLASWYKLNCNTNHDNIYDKRGVSYVLNTMNKLSKLFQNENNFDVSMYIEYFIKQVGLEVSLSKLNVKKSDLAFILENINIERLSNNPRTVSLEELQVLLEDIY